MIVLYLLMYSKTNVSSTPFFCLSLCSILTFSLLPLQDFLYVTPTPIQAARAGNTIYALLLYRNRLNKGVIRPVCLF